MSEVAFNVFGEDDDVILLYTFFKKEKEVFQEPSVSIVIDIMQLQFQTTDTIFENIRLFTTRLCSRSSNKGFQNVISTFGIGLMA